MIQPVAWVRARLKHRLGRLLGPAAPARRRQSIACGLGLTIGISVGVLMTMLGLY